MGREVEKEPEGLGCRPWCQTTVLFCGKRESEGGDLTLTSLYANYLQKRLHSNHG